MRSAVSQESGGIHEPAVGPRLGRLSSWLLLLSIPLISRAAEVYVYEPQHHGRYYTNPADGSASVPVHFEVFGGSAHVPGCLQLKNLDTDSFALETTCLDSAEFSLNRLVPGRYMLSLYARGASETAKVVEFEVRTMDDAAPTIQFPALVSDGVTVAVPEGSQEALPLTLKYELINAEIPLSRFRVCVTTQDSTNPICFPSDRSEIVLSNLGPGTYKLSFEVSLSQEPYMRFPHTKRDIVVRVFPLEDMLPSIVTYPHDELDYAVTSAEDSTVVILNYHLVGESSAIELVQVCVQVDPLPDMREPLLQITCLAPKDRSLQLSNMRMGSYNVKLVLRSLAAPQTFYPSSLRDIPIYIRLPEEFLPTYEWQELKAWHTVPSGLEIRLPLSESKSLRKEARIPSPWRLQLAMPAPCSFFLRREVFRDTSVNEILYARNIAYANDYPPLMSCREAAAVKCDRPSHCFSLSADGAIVQGGESAESAGLFNRRLELHLNPDCG